MLIVENLQVSYGQIKALKGISFEVPKNKIVTLIGSNGAGKSTTLRSISGLIRSQGGSIKFKDREIRNMAAHELVKLGMNHVPEGRRIFATLTVYENLEMAAWLLKGKSLFKERVDEVFELFPRLKERRNQLGGTLSGGEQQMLAVGRAIVTGGDFILFDEPSMGLSPLLVEEIFTTIKKVRDRGATIQLGRASCRERV